MSSLSLREFLLRFYSSLGCSIRILLCHKVDGSPRGSIWLFFTSGTQSIFLWNIYISLMLLHPGEFKHFLTKMSCSLMLHFAAIRAAIKPKKKPWCNNNLMCWHLYDRLLLEGRSAASKACLQALLPIPFPRLLLGLLRSPFSPAADPGPRIRIPLLGMGPALPIIFIYWFVSPQLPNWNKCYWNSWFYIISDYPI